MPGSAAKVVITERQHEVLRKMSTATTLAQRLVQRATIILLAFAGMANQDIAARVGRERHQIGMWRRRWQRAFHDLVRIECTEDSPAALRHAIEALLSDEPRPGCPGKFSAEQLTLLFALACEPPEKSGLPITHWTEAELAAEAIQRGIVESISASQVNRLLREAELQPHRSRYWLNSTEKDPELFQAQVQIVCACYHDAPQLYFYHDTHTICVDEMTGIQALERIAPTLAMQPGQGEIRFVYTPKHSSWLNQIEIVFGVIMRKVVRRGSFTSVDDLRTKLLAFIEYFNQVFAKPFKWTYTGRPLQA